MRTLLFIVLFIAILITPSSAENVTIEIFETTDIFYISLDDGELIACPDDECTLNITNYTTNLTTTELELSKSDKKDIAKDTAKYLFLEMEVNGIDTGGVTKTFINESLIVTRNEVIDSVLPALKNTFLPEIDKVKALEANLTASHDIIRDLRIEAGKHDIKVSGLEDKIELREDELLNTKIGIAGIAFLFGMSLILQGNRLQRGASFIKNMRK